MDYQPVLPPSQPIPEPPHRSGLIRNVIIGSIALAVIIVGVVAWKMLSSDGKGLTVSIVAPTSLQPGIPAEIAVNMSNESGSDLKEAQVSLALPDGLIFVGTPGSRTVENHKVGNLPADQLTKEIFKVMPTTLQNTIVPVKAIVSYIPGTLSSRFEVGAQENVVIGEPGIQLNVAPPTKAFAGESFDTEISYKNVSNTAFDNVQIALAYPTGFTVKSATTPAFDEASTVWHIGPLPAGAQGTFLIKGFVVGQDNENFEIKATMSAAIGEGMYDIATQSAAVTELPSPLSIRVGVAPAADAIFGTGETLHYRLSYTNNTQTGLRDVIVRAKLIGEMLDLKSLNSDGVLRATDNTIVWNASRVKQFAILPPSAIGYLEFSIQTKKSYPITRLSSKNYTVTVHAEIESPTVPPGIATDKTLGLAELTSKIRGALTLNTLGYYRDAPSGILNSGVFPPKVGQPTQFTIHWLLRNMSTDVDTVHLRASLGPNVRYTGVYKTSVASSSIVYNDRTQEISWDVAQIQATRGVLTDPLEMIFQAELTPAIDQVGGTPEIIQGTSVSYRDAFTGEQRTTSAAGVTTRLPDDATIVGDRGVRE